MCIIFLCFFLKIYLLKYVKYSFCCPANPPPTPSPSTKKPPPSMRRTAVVLRTEGYTKRTGIAVNRSCNRLLVSITLSASFSRKSSQPKPRRSPFENFVFICGQNKSFNSIFRCAQNPFPTFFLQSCVSSFLHSVKTTTSSVLTMNTEKNRHK